MGYTWNGRTYSMDWHPYNDDGTISPDKDWQANAEYAAANNTQNPYTNEAGASPYDKSGLVPGNEPGSTLPRVAGTASQTPAYRQNGNWAPLSALLQTQKATQAPKYAPPPFVPSQAGGDMNQILPVGNPIPYGGSGRTAELQMDDLPESVSEIIEMAMASAPSGPRRVSGGDARTPFLIAADTDSDEDSELARLAKLLSGL